MVECEFKSGGIKYKWCSVLIDTWWNVNNNTIELDDVSSGFNRYMVECEFQVKGELICHMKF